MKASISKPHLNLRYESSGKDKYEDQSLTGRDILHLLDLEDTGYIDLENLVLFMQKMLLQRIPTRHKNAVDSVLRNYVFDYRSFRMPSQLFYKLYEGETSKVLTENTRRHVRNRINSLSMVQNQLDCYDLPFNVNPNSAKNAYTHKSINRNVEGSILSIKPRPVAPRPTRSPIKSESFISLNKVTENLPRSKSPGLCRSYTGLYESRKKIERKIETKDRQLYSSIYRCMERYGQRTPPKKFIYSYLKNLT